MRAEVQQSTHWWRGDRTLLLLLSTGVLAASGVMEAVFRSRLATAAEPVAETPAVVQSSTQSADPAAATVAPVTVPDAMLQVNSASEFLGAQPRSATAAPLEESSDSMSQVTSVSQFSDVKPTDWAFQALQSLVERYGCIVGYPDKTYRGNRATTRYEFAAGLNACLDKIQELIAAATADFVKKEDLEIIQRLQEEFAAELAALRGRVDALEVRAATLEKQQFSPTTRLLGSSLFLVGNTFGDRANNTRANDTQEGNQAFFAYFTQLIFISSFTGQDALTTSFTATNVPLLTLTTGTAQANLVTDPSFVGPNVLFLDGLNYRFPVGDRLTVWLGINTLQPFQFIPTVNPIIATLDGPLSRFSWFNPAVYRPGFNGVGPGIAYKFSNTLQLHAAYLAAGTPSSDPSIGYFSANNTVVSQLTFTPTRQFTVALTYAHKYFRTGSATLPVNLFGGTGSDFALRPFQQNATSSDNFGLQFNWRINQVLSFGGWAGYTKAYQLNNGDSEATIINGSLNLTFSDLLKKGNQGGFIVGIPPKVTSSDYRVGGVRRQDPDTSLHLEVFYTYRVNNNISITPNLYVITSPENNSNNQPIWVGIIRTNFAFW